MTDSYENSMRPSDTPSRGLLALLQVLQWGLPIIKFSAKLLVVETALETVLLLLRFLLVVTDGACW